MENENSVPFAEKTMLCWEKRHPFKREGLLLEHVQSEMDFHGRVSSFSEYIVPLLHAGKVQIGNSHENQYKVIFLMPYMKEGALTKYIPQICSQGAKAILSAFKNIVIPVAICHAHGVHHRDIKPDNFLKQKDRFLLTDFGTAEELDGNSFSTKRGTPAYTAPELVELVEARLDGKLDMWGLGCILYELMTGGSIYGFDKKVNRKVFSQKEKSLGSILSGLLHEKPEQRWGLSQLTKALEI